MLGSLLNVVSDVVKVVAAPVEIALDITSVVTKPIADLSQEAVSEVKSAVKDITD